MSSRAMRIKGSGMKSSNAVLEVLDVDVHAVDDEAAELALLEKAIAECDDTKAPQQPLADPEAEARRLARRRAVSEAYKTAPVVVPGGAVVYVGRLPGGMEEDALRAYFSQFGTLGRLRLLRSPRTGGSRHAAFIEFRDADVAAIAVETMHNYLIRGHLLQCRVVPEASLHAELWKGSHSPFVLLRSAKTRAQKRNASIRTASVDEATARLAAVSEKCASYGYDASTALVGSLEAML